MLEHGEWMLTTQRARLDHLEKFYHAFVDGFALLRDRRTNAAFSMFAIAFDLLPLLLKQNHVLFLPYIYHILKGKPCSQHEGEEVIQSLFDLTSRLVEQNYPSMLSIAQSFASLSVLSATDRNESASRAYQATCRHLKMLVPARAIATAALKHSNGTQFVTVRMQMRRGSKILC
jgi:hypothetical protein